MKYIVKVRMTSDTAPSRTDVLKVNHEPMEFESFERAKKVADDMAALMTGKFPGTTFQYTVEPWMG